MAAGTYIAAEANFNSADGLNESGDRSSGSSSDHSALANAGH
jgi:hypothetical protein